MNRVALMAVVYLSPALAAAQGNTAELLDRAARYHADLDMERELVILRQVISPSSPFVVTHEQRVLAYKYLGAALVVLGQADSGVLYFRAALERDPFVDLETQKFTPAEIAAFNQAKRLTFGLGVRAIAVDTIDPRTERLTFTILSTHAADLRVQLRSAGTAAGLTLYAGDNDGPRELQWNGLLADGRLAPSGRYELVLAGVSRLTQQSDSTRLYFSVQQDYPPLEDTLPALHTDELLPEQQPSAVASRELFRGLGIAAAAFLIPRTLANGELRDGGRSLATGVVGVASVAAVAGFIHRRRHREITANIAANSLRRAERVTTNATILKRNRERLDQARLIVAPAAGIGP